MNTVLRIDADTPWPGLESYNEADHPWFQGRHEEAEALLRLVERETLSVLYGRSGLGKTSLVQAGLFPRLRASDFLPIRLHLVLTDDAQDLRRQVGNAIARECATNRIEAAHYDGNTTLWEYFYKKNGEFWSSDDRLITPVLVFDQFEEIFTLGREYPARRQLCEALLTEIGDLVENRRPTNLRARLEESAEFSAQFDPLRSPPKILLSFREDYLADFDVLYDYLRARTSNRLRLLPMAGDKAAAAIVAASPEYLDDEAAAQIVRFIDPRERPSEQLVIEPALLSLVCHKLNEHRKQQNGTHISVEWLADGSAHNILEQFYEGAFSALDTRLRDFVEDHLLTSSGHRDSCALENALATPGIDPLSLQALIDRRLLRREERGGQVRLELIHDVLTQATKASRDARRERQRLSEAERQKAVQRKKMWGLSFSVAALLLIIVFVLQQEQRLRKVTETVVAVMPRLERYSTRTDIPPSIKSALLFSIRQLKTATEQQSAIAPRFFDNAADADTINDKDIREVKGGFLVKGVRIRVLPEVKAVYPDLVKLIFRSESIDNQAKQDWIDALPSMTDEQVDRLFSILETEKTQLRDLNRKYQEELKILVEKKSFEFALKLIDSDDTLTPRQANLALNAISLAIKEERISKSRAVSTFKAIAKKLSVAAESEADAYAQFERAMDGLFLLMPDSNQKLAVVNRKLQLTKLAHAAGIAPKADVANGLLNVSWYLLELGKAKEAEQACHDGLTLMPNYLSLETNLAHALALQGKTTQAMTIYTGNIGKTIVEQERKKWEKTILDDFKSLKDAGITLPIFDDVRPFMESAVARSKVGK